MNSFMGSTFAGFLLIAIGAVAVSAFLHTTIDPPAHAIVFFNDTEQVYYPEPCVDNDTYARNNNRLREGAYEEVALGDYELALDCPLTVAQKGRSLLGVFLQEASILAPLPSRWDENGHWLY